MSGESITTRTFWMLKIKIMKLFYMFAWAAFESFYTDKKIIQHYFKVKKYSIILCTCLK